MFADVTAHFAQPILRRLP